MPLMTGTWKMNFNGSPMDLVIQQVDSGGFVIGTVGTSYKFSGLWDEASQRLSFSPMPMPIVTSPQDRTLGAIYTGYLFATPTQPAPGEDFEWTLVGTMQITDIDLLHSHGGNARRSTFGWYAKVGVVT